MSKNSRYKIKWNCFWGKHETVTLKAEHTFIKMCKHCKHTEYLLLGGWQKIERNEFSDNLLSEYKQPLTPLEVTELTKILTSFKL